MATLGLALACLGAEAGAPAHYGKHPGALALVRELVERHGFVEQELRQLFARTQRLEPVLKAIAPPKDARSWLAYRERFLTERRIGEGLQFWRRHALALERAARELGVPEEVIVAILGVESFYGRQAGAYRVVDALATLAFDYPPRAAFFRAELEQFLLFARESGLDAFSVKGSYAGAIGIPQFMPGSYRRYALDFDGDGIADLRASAADSIGSVAHFLREHGWRPGEPVLLPAQVSGDRHRALVEAGIEPGIALGRLPEFGVAVPGGLALDTPVALIDLASPGAPTEFRLGLRNFYVITRYNRSSFYAAVVHDLAHELRTRRPQDGGR